MLYLKEPTIFEKDEIVDMCFELQNSNYEYKFEGVNIFKGVSEETYFKFLNKLRVCKFFGSINSEWANQTTYVLIDEVGHIYGCASLRHNLNERLIKYGGHIGYAIRPSERAKGYGSIQLKLLLEKAYELGINQVLITCRENNIPSKLIIDSCIGRPDYLTDSMYPGIREYRYWIDVKDNLDKVKVYKKD